MELDLSAGWGAFLIGVINLAATVTAICHAVLTKRDVRAAAGWTGLILLVPILGWVIYFVLGINRIQRRARELRHIERRGPERLLQSLEDLGARRALLPRLARANSVVATTRLATGNTVELLRNGDETYPAMLEAIAQARTSIALSTYIFNHDEAGLMFVEALAAAQDRGVRVRILIDGLGTWYSFPSMIRKLREKNLPHARYLYSLLPWRMAYLNLRNHQKIMVVDGTIGFTGGINIAKGNLLSHAPHHPIRDTHFRITGPVVRQLMETFATEWEFTTGEQLVDDTWFPDLASTGNIIARGLPGGPDLGKNPIRWTLMTALTEARERIRIVTPYFLPDITLRTLIALAAMRGVQVDIVLPEKNNLAYIAWAAMPQLEELTTAGVHVWFASGPFDHSKLMTVDDGWSLIGSANWDPRSLRLNFEFNLECYGDDLAHAINREIDARLANATKVTSDMLHARPLHRKLRDGFVRLLSPYL